MSYSGIPWRKGIEVYWKCNGACWYCGEDEWTKMTIDHLAPTDTGRRNNNIDNLVLACKSCNSRKGTKPLEEYRKWIEDKQTIDFTFEQRCFIKEHYGVDMALPEKKAHLFFGEKNNGQG